MGLAAGYFDSLREYQLEDYMPFMKFINKQKRYNRDDIDIILKAYKVANKYHKKQTRLSGERYIVHPINVAYLLAKFGFDSKTVAAGLLHDVLEDTKYTMDELKETFGNEIAYLVDGATKMKDANFSSRSEQMVANHKKILQYVTKDARIIAIKLCDRLHNMMTLGYMPGEKQIEKSLETMEFFVPTAKALGIYRIKDLLQDLALYYLEPVNFEITYILREGIRKNYVWTYKELGDQTKDILENQEIIMKYDYKIKNIASIFDAKKSGMDLYDIKDLVAVIMILKEKSECYKALKASESVFEVIPESLEDYIKNPRYNGYQSLNEVLHDKNRNKNVQVRIRTESMHISNKMGVISNWNLSSQEKVREMMNELIYVDDASPDEYMKVAQKTFLKDKGD